MDNGLSPLFFFSPETMGEVLILIVMDNGLSQYEKSIKAQGGVS